MWIRTCEIHTASCQKLYFCSKELLYTCSSCHISVAQLHIIHSPRSWTPALPASSFSFLFQYKTTQKQYTHITQQSKSFHTSDLPCLLCGTKEQRTHLCTNHNTIIWLIHLPVSLTLAVWASLHLSETKRKQHSARMHQTHKSSFHSLVLLDLPCLLCGTKEQRTHTHALIIIQSYD